MSNEQKIEEAHKHLESLMWDDYTQRLFAVASFTSGRRTKNLSEYEAEYIMDGLNYKGKFRQDWEGREEFLWRFLDVLVDRSEARLLLSAAIAASQKGVDWSNKPEPTAEITYEQWVKDSNEQWIKEANQRNERREDLL